MTTISAVIFLVSATVHLAAIEIIMLDNDGWTASANAMCTCYYCNCTDHAGYFTNCSQKNGETSGRTGV